jgi:lactobin A/cerein 7B family class IIb bacteriocin
MTIEAAAEFIGKIQSDEVLMAAMGEAMSGATGTKQKSEALSKLGTENGYKFSADDAIKIRFAYRAEIAKQSPDAGIELTDEDLEAVSGGWFLAGLAAVAAVVTVNEAVRGKGSTAGDLRAIESVSLHGLIGGGNSPISDFLSFS